MLSFAIEDWLDGMEEHPSLVRAAMVEMALERERLCDLLAGDAGEVVLE